MGVLDQLLAGIDNTKRVVGRNVSDMVDDPRLYAEKIIGALRHQNAGVAPIAAGGELTNRPLTREEIISGYIDNFAGAGITKARPPTVFEQRHLMAQRNASLPVEQGGLGLPANNTAMDRAKAMEFDTPVYRGQSGEISDVVAKRSPKTEQLNLSSVHVAENPEYANRYAGKNGEAVFPMLLRKGDLVDATSLVKDGSPELEMMKSLLPRGQKPYLSRGGEGLPTDPLVAPPLQSFIDTAGAQKAEKVFAGKDAIKYNAVYGNLGPPGQGMTITTKSPSYAVLKPENLRSRFAAFDPMRRHEADILGFANPQLLGGMALGSGGILAAPAVIEALREKK